MSENELQRTLITASGAVRDVEAACECMCSCHPRVSELHDGGASCPCQLTTAERAAKWDEFLEAWAAIEQDPAHVAAEAARKAEFDAEADALGVIVDHHGGGAPYVIEGVVDGRAFYLRERGDMWRVCVAGDDEPLRNPWRDAEAPSECVAEGITEWGSGERWEIDALHTAVRAVRQWAARRNCAHGGGKWCPACGTELDPSWWRGPATA